MNVAGAARWRTVADGMACRINISADTTPAAKGVLNNCCCRIVFDHHHMPVGRSAWPSNLRALVVDILQTAKTWVKLSGVYAVRDRPADLPRI